MKNSEKKEQSSTYFVQDRWSQDELVRLNIQGQMMTRAMGGLLSEQPDPTLFQRVLDIACGPGEWVIEAAKTYPAMSLVGIDISQGMIEYARKQAENQHVADRVDFHVMDALRTLELPADSFDLVNLRCSLGFMRKWDWPQMLSELKRVCKPGGVVRITDAEAGYECNDCPALIQFSEISQDALFQAGNLFEQASDGLTAHLAPLLRQHVCSTVQTKVYATVYRAGTPDWETYHRHVQHTLQTLRPFILKWGKVSRDYNYDALCREVLREIQRDDFSATWNLLTAWCSK